MEIKKDVEDELYTILEKAFRERDEEQQKAAKMREKQKSKEKNHDAVVKTTLGEIHPRHVRLAITASDVQRSIVRRKARQENFIFFSVFAGSDKSFPFLRINPPEVIMATRLLSVTMAFGCAWSFVPFTTWLFFDARIISSHPAHTSGRPPQRGKRWRPYESWPRDRRSLG
jgi:hypothetical protein